MDVPPQREKAEPPESVEGSASNTLEGDIPGTSPKIDEDTAKLNALLPSPQESREIDEEDFELNLLAPLSSVEPPQEVTEPVDFQTETSLPDEEPAVEDPVPRVSPSPLSMPQPLSSETMSKPLFDFAAATPVSPLHQAQPPQPRRARRLPRWLTRAVVPAAVLIVAVLAFGLLVPDPDPKIYNQYSSLYAGWLQHRLSVATDPCPELVERAKAELDERLPWLEEHTEPGNRRRSLLLFAGCDLRKALDSPPGQAAPGERRLKGPFEQLDEIHAPDK